jgi:DNA primase
LRLSQDKIEEIRKSLDIVDVIGEYVRLSRQGKSYVGLCPFHSERTPSFSVSPDKQLYHCFGCGAGGNVFTFIMEIESLSFPEAVQFLAEKANIDIGTDETVRSPEADPQHRDRRQLTEGMELLTKFYHYLLTTAKYGAPGMHYLRERGFTAEMIERFRIGYAVNSWNAAASLIAKRHIDSGQMLKAGIIGDRGFGNRYFDRFRNRIIFPIFNMRGRPVAFGGRTIADAKPKYLNSPESAIFHKGNILYGYHLARQSIRKLNQVVLLEGYVDVVRAHQAGVTNSVASMGTSLTERQASVLLRMADTIVICYDSDDAGIEASFRAAGMLTGEGKVIKIAKMPQGFDPDDYIRKFGGERFKRDVIGASRTLMTFKMDYLRRKRNLSDEGDRLLYIEDVLGEIAKLHRAVERDHYLRLLSEEFSISLDALKHQERQIFRTMKRHSSGSGGPSAAVPGVQTGRLPNANETAERLLLAHMMSSREIADRVRDEIGGAFSVPVHQVLAAYLYAFYEEGHPPDEGLFIQRIDDPRLQQKAVELSLIPLDRRAEDREIDDCIRQIVRHARAAVISDLEEERKEAERSGDNQRAAQLLSEMIEKKKQLNSESAT